MIQCKESQTFVELAFFCYLSKPEPEICRHRNNGLSDTVAFRVTRSVFNRDLNRDSINIEIASASIVSAYAYCIIFCRLYTFLTCYYYCYYFIYIIFIIKIVHEVHDRQRRQTNENKNTNILQKTN